MTHRSGDLTAQLPALADDRSPRGTCSISAQLCGRRKVRWPPLVGEAVTLQTRLHPTPAACVGRPRRHRAGDREPRAQCADAMPDGGTVNHRDRHSGPAGGAVRHATGPQTRRVRVARGARYRDRHEARRSWPRCSTPSLPPKLRAEVWAWVGYGSRRSETGRRAHQCR